MTVPADGGPAIPLGTDGAPPYRVYWDSSALAAGSRITVTATARGGSDVVTTVSEFVLGERG